MDTIVAGAVQCNTQELKRNTGEIKKFNRTSTNLALAMIFLGIVNLMVSFLQLVKK